MWLVQVDIGPAETLSHTCCSNFDVRSSLHARKFPDDLPSRVTQVLNDPLQANDHEIEPRAMCLHSLFLYMYLSPTSHPHSLFALHFALDGGLADIKEVQALVNDHKVFQMDSLTKRFELRFISHKRYIVDQK